ncbi:ankyrin repeat-containing domain protein [Aspergillus pseudoustus]|uniref:Ankyrin repeat-containing domain protein n=1 Tax=Aspergillus pseudoustus TaxID=1810923 RepID=A0ABR4JSA8_9EURO
MTDQEHGLSVDWSFTLDAEVPEPPGVDVVVIHGLYGAPKENLQRGLNPGSGSSSWVEEYTKSLDTDSRRLSFKYDAKILCGVNTRDAIRHQARCLLEQLTAERQTDVKRSILFVAHDIGGLILKDALYLATVHGGEWAQITAYARVLLFSGCPHRSIDTLDLKDRLSAFVNGAYKPGWLQTRPTLALISGLVEAVTEINGLFVESKVYLRSYMLSVHAHESLPGEICQAFGSFSGALGYPFETLICENGSEGGTAASIRKYLTEQSDYINPPPPSELDRENLFISLAPPMDPFSSTRRPDSPILQVNAVKEWLTSPGYQILYAYGTYDMQEVGEQLFYSIEQLNGGYKRSLHPVLYFTFDAWDMRRNSLLSLLSALWMQMVGHKHRQIKGFTEVVMLQIAEERCWTEDDLMRWFRTVQQWSDINNVSLVVSGVDGCSSLSHRTLLKFLSKVAFGCGFVSRVAVTSSKPLDYTEGPSTWRCINLDGEAADPCLPSSIHNDLATLYPSNTVQQMLDPIAGDDPVSRNVLSEQLRMNGRWLQNVSILQAFFIETHRRSYSLECIVSRILSLHEDQSTIQSILTWAIHAARPLTVWEMAEAVRRGQGSQSNIINCKYIVMLLTSVFAGILEIKHNEIRIPNRRLRLLFTAPSSDSETSHVWHGLRETADFTITKTCLDYLCLPEVQKEMQGFITQSSGSVQLPHHHERNSLCLYAVEMWPLHFFKQSDTSGLLDDLLHSDFGRLWGQAFWSICNPATRLPDRIESLYPVLAGLGHLPDPNSPQDINQCIIEAARYGHSATVTTLLGLAQDPVPMHVLLDAILAAVAGCHETIALQLLDRFDIKGSKWPPALLYRAAWLDLANLAEKLLQMGCPPEPGGPLASEERIIPVRIAAATDSLDTLLVLMDHGADIAYRGQGDKGVLHYCALYCSERTARAIVARRPDLLDIQDSYGDTALAFAVLWGIYPMLKCLLELGADPAMKVSADRRDSPLMLAAQVGQIECTHILLQHNVDPNETREGRAAALGFAAINGHAEICKILLDHGADPNHPAIATPILSTALQCDDPIAALGIVKLLLEAGAKVDATEEDGETSLFYAVRSGNITLVQCLLDHGADINTWAHDWCPLFASFRGGPEICTLLIEKGADIETPNSEGTSALILATIKELPDIVSLLLARNVAPDAAMSKFGYTALVEAVFTGNAQITRMLIEAGANAKHQTDGGYTPLHLSVANDCLRVLLEFRKRIDVDQRLDSGETALMYAPMDEDTPIEHIKLLINAGSDLNAQNNLGYTALCQSVLWNKPTVTRLLLNEPDLDINRGSQSRGCPLHIACRLGFLETVKLLVDKGADVNNAVSSIPGTPLQSACFVLGDDPMPIIHHLLDHGADVNTVGGLAATALNVAAMTRGPELIRFFLEKGADAQKSDSQGALPVHYAAIHGIDSLVTILGAGGRPFVSDVLGRSPLHWAAQNGKLRVVEHLLNILEPSSVNAPDIDGWTPLCWAARGVEESESDTFKRQGDSWNQLGVIQHLLKSGASLSVEAKIGDGTWSPLEIACYSKAPVDVIKALKQPGQKVGDVKIAASGDAICDGCYWYVCGNYYACTECLSYYLCPKCYFRRDIVHPSNHEFTERTHDIPPPESETKAILQELNIATDNDDSDSSSEPDTTARRARRSRGRRLFRSATFDLDSSDDD